MATCTQAQLAEKVLIHLGVKAQGQNPSADDLDLVSSVIDSVADGLRPSGAVYFDLDAIPEWAQWPLVEMVGARVAPSFGRARPEAEFNRARADFLGSSNTAAVLTPAKGRFF